MTMRVGIQGWGSEGDLRPLVALAARLRSEGHSPRLVLTSVDGKDYVHLCRALDVPLRVVPEKMEFSLERLALSATSADPSKLLRAVLDLGFSPHVEAMYQAALDLCRTSDVVVGGSSSFCVKAAALKTGIPYVAVDYYPGVVPSRYTPPPGLADWGWFNRLRWVFLRLLFDMAFRKAPAKFFAEKGLAPIRHTIPDVIFSERLNLHAASPAFCPPARDWSAIHQVCGEFVLPEGNEPWQPSPSLRAFLEGGDSPLLVSLGSMEHMAPSRARDLAVASARLAKVRAVIQTKRDGNAEGQDGDLYFLPWAPHRRLLPLCRAVVHHGGAGTTHAVLRAGKPSVVLPFIFEQQLWARRLQQVGAGGTFVSFWKATPEKVAARIRQAIESGPMRSKALELAGAMAPEDGTGMATRLLERFVAHGSGDHVPMLGSRSPTPGA
jgi:sterol 3beta-glucosyltransferase